VTMTPNKSLERSVKLRGRAVLAMNCRLGTGQAAVASPFTEALDCT